MLKKENFSFALPEINSLPPENPEQAGIYKHSVKNSRKSLVLIFSRDVDTRYMFKTLLNLLDFDVAEAEDKTELAAASAVKRPDLILMDVELPFADSLTVMSELRKDAGLERVPFVLLSGMAQKGYRSAAFAAGASEYLIKPIDFDLLECSLQLLLFDNQNNQQLGGTS